MPTILNFSFPAAFDSMLESFSFINLDFFKVMSVDCMLIGIGRIGLYEKFRVIPPPTHTHTHTHTLVCLDDNVTAITSILGTNVFFWCLS